MEQECGNGGGNWARARPSAHSVQGVAINSSTQPDDDTATDTDTARRPSDTSSINHSSITTSSTRVLASVCTVCPVPPPLRSLAPPPRPPWRLRPLANPSSSSSRFTASPARWHPALLRTASPSSAAGTGPAPPSTASWPGSSTACCTTPPPRRRRTRCRRRCWCPRHSGVGACSSRFPVVRVRLVGLVITNLRPRRFAPDQPVRRAASRAVRDRGTSFDEMARSSTSRSTHPSRLIANGLRCSPAGANARGDALPCLPRARWWCHAGHELRLGTRRCRPRIVQARISPSSATRLGKLRDEPAEARRAPPPTVSPHREPRPRNAPARNPSLRPVTSYSLPTGIGATTAPAPRPRHGPLPSRRVPCSGAPTDAGRSP